MLYFKKFCESIPESVAEWNWIYIYSCNIYIYKKNTELFRGIAICIFQTMSFSTNKHQKNCSLIVWGLLSNFWYRSKHLRNFFIWNIWVLKIFDLSAVPLIWMLYRVKINTSCTCIYSNYKKKHNFSFKKITPSKKRNKMIPMQEIKMQISKLLNFLCSSSSRFIEFCDWMESHIS